MTENGVFREEIHLNAIARDAFRRLPNLTTLEESLPAATGTAREQLNGHKLPHIAKPVIEMSSTPSDAILHPAAAALQARDARRATSLQARETAQEVPVTPTLPRSGDIVVKPTSVISR